MFEIYEEFFFVNQSMKNHLIRKKSIVPFQKISISSRYTLSFAAIA